MAPTMCQAVVIHAGVVIVYAPMAVVVLVIDLLMAVVVLVIDAPMALLVIQAVCAPMAVRDISSAIQYPHASTKYSTG